MATPLLLTPHPTCPRKQPGLALSLLLGSGRHQGEGGVSLGNSKALKASLMGTGQHRVTLTPRRGGRERGGGGGQLA